MVYLIGFLIPLYDLSFKVFIQFSWYKLIPFILVLLIIFSRKKVLLPQKRIFSLVLILMVYFLFVTLVNYILNSQSGAFNEAIEAGQTYLRVHTHMFVQFIMICASICQIWLFPYFIKSKYDVDTFVRGFIDGNMISVVACGFQYALFKYGLYATDIVTSGYIRISGLGGEPKQFGAFLLLAVFIILANNVSNKPIAIKNSTLKCAIFIVGIFLCLSLSVWMGLIFGLLTIALLTLDWRKAALVILAILSIWSLLMFNEYFKQMVDLKVVQRNKSIEQFMAYAPMDALALLLIKNNLAIAFFGAGAGGDACRVANLTFLDSVPEPIRKAGIIQRFYNGTARSSFSPGSFLIKYIVEYGLVGFALLLITVWHITKKIRKTRYCRFIVLMTVCVLVANVVSTMFTYVYFSLLGVLYGYYYNQARQAKIPIDRFNSEVEQH